MNRYAKRVVLGVVFTLVLAMAGPVHAAESEQRRLTEGQARRITHDKDVLAKQWAKVKQEYPEFAMSHLQMNATLLEFGHLIAGDFTSTDPGMARAREGLCELVRSGALIVMVPGWLNPCGTPCADKCLDIFPDYAGCFRPQPSGRGPDGSREYERPSVDEAESCVQDEKDNVARCVARCNEGTDG